MTPRQRRIAELIQARARIDAQFRSLAQHPEAAEPVLARVPPPSPNADWLTQAHRNQIHLAFMGPHIRHNRRTAA